MLNQQMKKKEVYVAPRAEVVDLECEGAILGVSNVQIDPDKNPDVDYGDSDDMWGSGQTRSW